MWMAQWHRPRCEPELDESSKKAVLAILAVGGTRETAAKYVQRTPAAILRAAKQDPDFGEQLRKAEAQLEVAHLRNIELAAKDNWRASVWLLERIYPDKYGPRRGGAISLHQLSQLASRMSEVLMEEVPSSQQRERILRRLETLFLELEQPERPDDGEI